jgi:hypothetical protein
MTLIEFSEVFALLAKQLRQTDADEADIEAYYRSLKDLDLPLVAMAADRMAREGGARSENPHWFPKTSEWRAMVGQVEGERQGVLAHRLRALHKAGQVLCAGCDDTGWTLGSGSRYQRCGCADLRRLEVLGVRPMPLLIAEVADDAATVERVTAMIRPVVKVMR